MVVEPDQRRQGPAAALEALADAGVAVAAGALLRSRPFGIDERRSALLAAGQVALVLRAYGVGGAGELPSIAIPALELAGEALAAGSDGSRTRDELTRLAAAVSGAAIAL